MKIRMYQTQYFSVLLRYRHFLPWNLKNHRCRRYPHSMYRSSWFFVRQNRYFFQSTSSMRLNLSGLLLAKYVDWLNLSVLSQRIFHFGIDIGWHFVSSLKKLVKFGKTDHELRKNLITVKLRKLHEIVTKGIWKKFRKI